MRYIRELSTFGRSLWAVSVCVVVVSYVLTPDKYPLSLIASLVGATALIFVSRGMVIGQILTVVFSVLYGIVSFRFHYWGEMITYLGMTAPIAAAAVVTWLRHPYKDTSEVTVHRLTGRETGLMLVLTAAVTGIFFLLLKRLDTPNLFFSAVSVTTSFLAVFMTALRSPYYALGYSANDIVLIILWILASLEDRSNLPMVFCFVIFLVNDSYGFLYWKRMQKRQAESPVN